MSAPATYGERMVAALSEAGFPPDFVGLYHGVRVARWVACNKPSLALHAKAREICRPVRPFNPEAWQPLADLLVHLDDVTGDEFEQQVALVGSNSLAAGAAL